MSKVVAWVSAVHTHQVECDPGTVTRELVDQTPVRCPDLGVAAEMISAIEQARKNGDSLGGVVNCVIRGCPPGWGQPVFDRLEADLARAMLSLPATKGFEIGSGFGGTVLTGLAHNDPFYMDGARVRTRTNRSGGVQGGITNGEDVLFRVAFKPTATVMREQETVTRTLEDSAIAGRGRHDPVSCRARWHWLRPWRHSFWWITPCDTRRHVRVIRRKPGTRFHPITGVQ